MRIMIIKLSSLGDVIHCLPCLNGLKEGFPSARIDWLIEAQNAALLQGHPYIDRLLILPRKSWQNKLWTLERIFPEFVQFFKTLRDFYYDIVIDFQGLLRSGVLVGTCKGKRKIGFNRVREMADLFYSEKVFLSTLNQHAVTRYLEILSYLGINTKRPNFYLPLQQGFAEEVNNLLRQIGLTIDILEKVVLVNPNARWPSKKWPTERFRELVKILTLQEKNVLLIGSAEEREKIAKDFWGLGNRVYNIAGLLSIKGLAYLMKKSACLVTNDSGPLHLAVAVGLPVVALFGPSNPVRTGPFGWDEEPERKKVLFSGESCAPCYKRVCQHQRCLMAIPVDQVIYSINSILGLS